MARRGLGGSSASAAISARVEACARTAIWVERLVPGGSSESESASSRIAEGKLLLAACREALGIVIRCLSHRKGDRRLPDHEVDRSLSRWAIEVKWSAKQGASHLMWQLSSPCLAPRMPGGA